tara:strand:- start:338 stop:511 length:174 start_codon:yes stop_codon:yes gene_type:complete
VVDRDAVVGARDEDRDWEREGQMRVSSSSTFLRIVAGVFPSSAFIIRDDILGVRRGV